MDSRTSTTYFPSMNISEGEILVKGKTFGRWKTKKFIVDQEQRVFALKSSTAKNKLKPHFLLQYKVVNQERKKDKIQFELVSKGNGKSLTLGIENEEQAKQLLTLLYQLTTKSEIIPKTEVIEKHQQPIQLIQKIDYEIPSFFDICEIRDSIHQIRKNQYNMENFKKVYDKKLQIYKNELNHQSFRVFIEFEGNCLDVIVQNLTDKLKINKWNSYVVQSESKLIKELHEDNAFAISEVRQITNLFLFKREFQYLQHYFQIENFDFIVQKQLDQKSQTKNYNGCLRYGIYSVTYNNNKTKFNYFTEQTMLGLNYPDEDSYFTQIVLQQLINCNNKDFKTEQISQEIQPSPQKKINQVVKTEPQQDSDKEQFFDCEEEDEMNDKLFIVKEITKQHIQDEVVKDVVEQNARRQSFLPVQIDTSENVQEWVDKKMKAVLSGYYCQIAIGIKHQLTPKLKDLASIQYLTTQEGGHYIFKKDFIREEKNGGLKVINEEKIAAQKAVVKFLITRIGASLLMGKSVTGISMPVTIFEARSNTERVCSSMGFAPIYLEEAAQQSDPYSRIKACSAFQFGFIFMYLSCEKPFNPILGETFQGFYDNCPIYCEQISHHPPVCAIQMYGRQYKIDARLELVANFHSNSVVGRNIGTVKVTFENPRQELYLTLAPGSLNGTTYGDRIMNYLEKQFIIDIKNKIIMEVAFNPEKKYCQQLDIEYSNQSDFLCGAICDVTDAAISRFQKEGYRKYKGLDMKNDIKQIKHKVKGIWTQEIKIDDLKLISIKNDFPIKMQQASNPIASDANYRMDLLWWKLRKFDESQQWKEKLEILQRQDRKLRESKGKKKN